MARRREQRVLFLRGPVEELHFRVPRHPRVNLHGEEGLRAGGAQVEGSRDFLLVVGVERWGKFGGGCVCGAGAGSRLGIVAC